MNLGIPPTGSVPIVAMSKPAKTDSHPFHSVLAPMEAETANPKKISANISGGPNALIAHPAMAPVADIIKIADANPPIAEQLTAAPIALPLSPRRVMG